MDGLCNSFMGRLKNVKWEEQTHSGGKKLMNQGRKYETKIINMVKVKVNVPVLN